MLALYLPAGRLMLKMTTRTIRLIANPNAGRGGRTRAAEIARFCELMKAHGVETEIARTSGTGDATQLAAQAAREGVREVVVSGGDGTINEVVQGLVGTGVRLGIWPVGTANVLARELRLPFAPESVAALVARGESRRVSVGCAVKEATGERRYFFLMAGVGLDASVVNRVRPRLKRRVGEGAYWYAGFAHLTNWPPPVFTLEVNGHSFPATFAVIGKAARYGGGLGITPRAHLDHPEFEICVINSHSRLRYIQLLLHAMRPGGVADNLAGVRYLRATRARAMGDAPVQVDGELIGPLPMTFEIANEEIEVIAPRVGDSERLK